MALGEQAVLGAYLHPSSTQGLVLGNPIVPQSSEAQETLGAKVRGTLTLVRLRTPGNIPPGTPLCLPQLQAGANPYKTLQRKYQGYRG